LEQILFFCVLLGKGGKMAFTMMGQAVGSTKSLRANIESLIALGQLTDVEKAEIHTILADLSEIIISLTRLNNKRKGLV